MNIVLQPFELADVDRLLSWVPDDEFLMLWSGPFFTPPLDRLQVEAYCLTGQCDPSLRKIYKAVDCDSGAAVGHIELNNIDQRNSFGQRVEGAGGRETLPEAGRRNANGSPPARYRFW